MQDTIHSLVVVFVKSIVKQHSWRDFLRHSNRTLEEKRLDGTSLAHVEAGKSSNGAVQRKVFLIKKRKQYVQSFLMINT